MRGGIRCVRAIRRCLAAVARNHPRAAVCVPGRCAARGTTRARSPDRRASDDKDTIALGVLDASAIAMVRAEAWPDPRDPDELHDALVSAGFLTMGEVAREQEWGDWLRELARGRRRRGHRCAVSEGVWVAAERLRKCGHGIDGALFDPPILAPPGRATVEWTRESALWRSSAAAWRSPARSHHVSSERRSASITTRRLNCCWRSRRMARCCAAGSHRAASKRSGAIADCSRGFIAPRCSASAPRSSRSRSRTSCGSCSRGSTSIRRRS